MKGLKPCLPGISQLALDSIDKQTNQLAIAHIVIETVFLVGGLYVGICLVADQVTKPTLLFSESSARWIVDAACFPVYEVGALIL